MRAFLNVAKDSPVSSGQFELFAIVFGFLFLFCPILWGRLASKKSIGGVSGLLFVAGHEDVYGPHESPAGGTANMEFGFAIGDRVNARPPKLAAHAIAKISRDSQIWLHTDLDALSTEALTAVNYHLPGGLSWPELSEVVGEVLSKAQVVGWV